LTTLASPNEIVDSPSATAPHSSIPLPARYLPNWIVTSASGADAVFANDFPLPDETNAGLASTAVWLPASPTSFDVEQWYLPQPSYPAATLRRTVRLLKRYRDSLAETGSAFHFLRGPQPTLSWDESFNRLREFESFEGDWDSYGADPISPDSLAVSRELLLSLVRPTPWGTMAGFLPSNIVPLADGRVQFEWFGAAAHLEVEVGAEKTFTCFFASGRGDARRTAVLNDATMGEVISLVSVASGAPVRWRTSL
jgi:hypothetical protein